MPMHPQIKFNYFSHTFAIIVLLHCSKLYYSAVVLDARHKVTLLNRHFVHLSLALDVFYFHLLVALSHSGKVTKAFMFTPCGYKMASKIVA